MRVCAASQGENRGWGPCLRSPPESTPTSRCSGLTPTRSWTLWPRSCATLSGAPAPSGWSRAPSLQPLRLPGRRGPELAGTGQLLQGEDRVESAPRQLGGAGGPRVCSREDRREAGEGVREASTVLRFIVGRERARVGP